MSRLERRARAERKLVARALSELSFEGILEPVALSAGLFRVAFGEARYEFRARRGAWGHLDVDAASVMRMGSEQLSAAQFFLDAREAHGMGAITLAHFFEEMQNTLFAEEQLLARQESLTADAMAALSDFSLQAVLDGHPKILLNKGRIGWSAADMEAYAPEFGARLRLVWLAVRADRATASYGPGVGRLELLREALSEEEEARLLAAADALPEGREAYYFLPVHPWQWQKVIRLQFSAAVARGELELLGTFGDEYAPQISLRTLSNVSRPGRADLKLPLTILNTSAYRGISGKYIPKGPSLSARFAALLEEDTFLRASGARVSRELGGVSLAQEEYAAIEAAPYRYHEQLGAIWRENPGVHGETMLTAALFQRDHAEQSVAGALIRRSDLSATEWLRAYFQSVVLPLYHLQVVHGIGLVAHGQNIVLRLENHTPVGMVLKDFQGDLRLAEGSFPQRDATLGTAATHLPRLPAAHLIHDLVTGHFVTVLRFLSAALAADGSCNEDTFYRLLGEEVQSYLREQNRAVPEALSLLRPEFERVLLNKVRFRIGYADSAERPLPALGAPLPNPIIHGLRAGGSQ